MTTKTTSQAHTPGPWLLEETDGTVRSKCPPTDSDQMGDYRGNIICSMEPALGAWPSLGRKHAEPETRANARLIACAPELLDALKEATTEGNYWHGPECSGKDMDHVCNCWVSRARAAISKATTGTTA